MKIHPVGAEYSTRMDRWTDTMKLIVTFHNFANRTKNIPVYSKQQNVSEKIDLGKLNKVWPSTGQ
jgi:hypothetical protein